MAEMEKVNLKHSLAEIKHWQLLPKWNCFDSDTGIGNTPNTSENADISTYY